MDDPDLARYRMRRPDPRYGFVRRPWVLMVRALDALGSALPRPRPSQGGAPRRVALLSFGHIGDAVLLTPALRAARRALPDSSITLFVGPWTASLFTHDPYVDAVQPFRASWMDPQGGLRSPKALLTASFEALAGRGLTPLLRGFDLAVSFMSYLPEHVAAARAQVPQRAGWGLYGGKFLLTHSEPFPWSEHALLRNLLLLQHAGLDVEFAAKEDRAPHLALSDGDHAGAEAYLQSIGRPAASLVALHVGAGYPSKRWPARNWTALARELQRQGDLPVFIGGPGDVEDCQSIADSLAMPYAIAAGHLNLRETAALVSRCRLFVGGDSGPAHLASAVGTRTISLFSGENDAAAWRPWGDHVTLLQAPPPCSPCGLRLCPAPGHPCMTELTVERVLAHTRVA